MHLIFYTEDADVCITGIEALGSNFEFVIVNGEVARTKESLSVACGSAVRPRIVARIKTHHPLVAGESGTQ
ncbi:hypothetical protein D3C76_1855330 [compost metagenome]